MASYFRDRFRTHKDDENEGEAPERHGSRTRKNLVGNARRREPSAPDSTTSSMAMSLSYLRTKRGSVFDYYRLEEELGRGAFARVFRGIRKRSGREVAIKVVSLRAIAERAVQDNQAKMQRLRQQNRDVSRTQRSKSEIEAAATARVIGIMQSEIEVMRRISKIPARKKKNIINLHDICIDEKRISIIMDLLTGGELFDRIVKRKRYTEKDAAYHFRRIMRALRTLHQNGIVHRDLKPENFVFQTPDENAQIKITDFGLAMIQGQEDIHASSIVGSPGYIAPEVLLNKDYGPACDVWSMGIILYILLVGGPPFHGRDDRELFRAIRKGKFRYPRNSGISALAKDLVAKMLVVNPKNRISVAGVLNHPWLIQRAAQQDVSVAVGRMQRFNAARKLKAVTTALAWGAKSGLRRDLYKILEGTDREAGFSGEELVLIRDALFKFKPSPTIARRQFVFAMRDLGFGTLPLEDMYDLFDGEGTDHADIVEILVGLSTAASSWNGSSQIRFCFDLYDRDGSGRVTLNDMGRVFRVVTSEMEASVVTSLASILGAWRPTQPVTYNELEEQLMATGSPELREQLDTRPLGLMADLPGVPEDASSRPEGFEPVESDGGREEEDFEDDDDGAESDTDAKNALDDEDHDEDDDDDDDVEEDDMDDEEDLDELDEEESVRDASVIDPDDEVLNRPNPSRVAKRDIAHRRGLYRMLSRYKQTPSDEA
ncbi:Protein kinase, putative [Hondaea fermentalgiana]|uniref:Protein kinase, putative n=1 Tax=Hondaea fermentalgiana TaxID=2315210 RepID=A0A2R5GW30_9STRA|nr:Protein kinase, putative [Hondaea fermentalgiana]|eukprot:GBG32144.1 Protein kinase, putative [Hondaea fermentalgiana]